ncbi:ADP-ribosylation factor GTPase-activating protein 1-like [Saccoglossus kowalevskii]
MLLVSQFACQKQVCIDRSGARNLVTDTKQNKLCFEYEGHNPQWVSVTYGIWICLECLGKHWSFRVHLRY